MRPVHWACTFGNSNILSFLSKSGAEMNPVSNPVVTSPFLIAAKHGFLNCINILIASKVPLDEQDGTGRTALHLSSWFNHFNIVSVLIKNGANIEIQDFTGRTALHLACWFGHEQTTKILLQAGAKVNVFDQIKRTPLHLACQHRRSQIVALLLQNGADTKAKDANGKTAEAIATEENCSDIVEMLQKHNKEALDEGKTTTESSSEKELIDETQKMKALIEKLGMERDTQVDKLNNLKEKIDSQTAILQSLQENDSELAKDIRMMKAQVQVLYGQVAGLVNGSVGSMAQIPGMGSSNTSHKQISSDGIPNKYPSSTSSSKQIKPHTKLCSICMKNKPSNQCKWCKNPFCPECSEQVKEKGCPFCQKINGEQSWLTI